MSKYTNMLADKYRCHCGTCEVQKGNVSEEECKICSHYAIREALQIADRLEHAKPSVSVGTTEPYSWLKNDSKTFNAYWEGVLVGYNQALADIRGDTE